MTFEQKAVDFGQKTAAFEQKAESKQKAPPFESKIARFVLKLTASLHFASAELLRDQPSYVRSLRLPTESDEIFGTLNGSEGGRLLLPKQRGLRDLPADGIVVEAASRRQNRRLQPMAPRARSR